MAISQRAPPLPPPSQDAECRPGSNGRGTLRANIVATLAMSSDAVSGRLLTALPRKVVRSAAPPITGGKPPVSRVLPAVRLPTPFRFAQATLVEGGDDVASPPKRGDGVPTRRFGEGGEGK